MFVRPFDQLFAWLRSIHDRYARVILAGIAALIVPLMVMTLVATLDNWRQDKDRDHLLACFDQYAAASSTSSKATRAASIAKDEATAIRDNALNAEGVAFQRLVKHILAETVTPEDVQALADALDARAAAGRRLDRKQDALDKARAENPIPSPPSAFCSD